jgi:hypothetical protein
MVNAKRTIHQPLLVRTAHDLLQEFPPERTAYQCGTSQFKRDGMKSTKNSKNVFVLLPDHDGCEVAICLARIGGYYDADAGAAINLGDFDPIARATAPMIRLPSIVENAGKKKARFRKPEEAYGTINSWRLVSPAEHQIRGALPCVHR